MTKITKAKRLNTTLESTGAEFLVLGNMLLNKISAYKTYLNYPDFDLIAVDSTKKTSVNIQVKSRYRTDYDGFIIKNISCDFVVFVALNRGLKKIKKDGKGGKKEPDFFIFPVKYMMKIQNKKSPWGKITRKNMVDYEKYKDRWDLISDSLCNKSKNK